MLKVEDIRRGFGGKEVLRGASFALPASTVAGLIGPSGGGKSVLLKIIGGILAPQSGRVDRQAGQGGVSLMFQEGALFDSLSVFDNVAFPLVHGKVPTTLLPLSQREEVRDRVEHILSRVGLAQAAWKMPGQLSGGMRRRVSLARALVARPKLALLDDPTAGLDPVASSVIMDLIIELQAEYRPTMIMVSHDLRRLLPVVDVVLALFDGKIAFDGSVSELAELHAPAIRTFVACRYDLGGEGSETVAPSQR